jgi:hypothetical protein
LWHWYYGDRTSAASWGEHSCDGFERGKISSMGQETLQFEAYLSESQEIQSEMLK